MTENGETARGSDELKAGEAKTKELQMMRWETLQELPSNGTHRHTVLVLSNVAL